MIRILHILPDISISNGAAGAVVGWHRNIDRSKVQFDYLICRKASKTYEGEILALGGRVHMLKPGRLPVGDIIHSHVTQLGFFYFPAARLYGVKNIIQHSHSTAYSFNWFKAMVNRFLFLLARPFSTRRIAVSQKAGEFLFGKNASFTVIANGVDLGRFYPAKSKEEAKKLYGVQGKTVLGHAGRFSKEKNHKFLIDVFSRYLIIDKNAVLILAGQGPLEAEIKNYTASKNLRDKVIFVGIMEDLRPFYSALDILVFPSISEGFGLVPLEAAACAVPSLVSDALAPEAACALIKRLPLGNAGQWAEEIQKILQSPAAKECHLPDIKQSAAALEKIYFGAVGPC